MTQDEINQAIQQTAMANAQLDVDMKQTEALWDAQKRKKVVLIEQLLELSAKAQTAKKAEEESTDK